MKFKTYDRCCWVGELEGVMIVGEGFCLWLGIFMMGLVN